MRIRPNPANRPYVRRNFRGPNYAETSTLNQTGLMSGMGGHPGYMVPNAMIHDAGGHAGYMGGEHSVFHTNASHVLSSPNTFNMMADATTAPYPHDTSMMKNQISPQGKQKAAIRLKCL